MKVLESKYMLQACDAKLVLWVLHKCDCFRKTNVYEQVGRRADPLYTLAIAAV